MSEPTTLGVILAGGRSKRMGRQKPFVPLAGKPLVQHGIERLKPQVSDLIINVNEDADRYAAFGLPLIKDSVDGHKGPLVGVLDALLWVESAPDTYDAVVTLPCDVPFIPANYVEQLAVAGENDTHTSFAQCPSGKHFLCAYWPKGVLPKVKSYIEQGKAKVETFHSVVGGVAVDFGEMEFDHFFNINTPEDVVEAEQMMISHEIGSKT